MSLGAYETMLNDIDRQERYNRNRNTTNNMIESYDSREIVAELKVDLMNKITRRIPSIFFEDFLNHLQNTSLLTQDQKTKLELGYSSVDCFLLIFFGMTHHKEATCDYYKEKYDVNKNFVHRTLQKLAPVIEEFNKTKLTLGQGQFTINNLERISQEEAIYEAFQDYHFLLDGVDVRFSSKSMSDIRMLFSESFKSKKFKYKPAFRIQVVTTLARKPKICWTCDGNGSGCHDMRYVYRSNLHMVANGMKGITDAAYINSFYPVAFLTPKKDPNEAEERINEKISKQRAPIEKVFGLLKLRFEFLYYNYRWPIRFFMPLFRLACVAINYIEGELTELELEKIKEIIDFEKKNLNDEMNDNSFPEVRINENGTHSVILQSQIERTNWSGRNRRVRDPHPTFRNENTNTNGIQNIGLNEVNHMRNLNNNRIINNNLLLQTISQSLLNIVNTLSTNLNILQNNSSNMIQDNALINMQNNNDESNSQSLRTNSSTINFNSSNRGISSPNRPNSLYSQVTNLLEANNQEETTLNEISGIIIGPRMIFGPPTWEEFYNNIDYEENDTTELNQNINEQLTEEIIISQESINR
jgi:hypothetical protein